MMKISDKTSLEISARTDTTFVTLLSTNGAGRMCKLIFIKGFNHPTKIYVFGLPASQFSGSLFK